MPFPSLLFISESFDSVACSDVGNRMERIYKFIQFELHNNEYILSVFTTSTAEISIQVGVWRWVHNEQYRG